MVISSCSGGFALRADIGVANNLLGHPDPVSVTQYHFKHE